MDFGNSGLVVKADRSQPRDHKFEPWHCLSFLREKKFINQRERERERERETLFLFIYLFLT